MHHLYTCEPHTNERTNWHKCFKSGTLSVWIDPTKTNNQFGNTSIYGTVSRMTVALGHGEKDNYSVWHYNITPKYASLKLGQNKITAKITAQY
jgi:hypothetical protein